MPREESNAPTLRVLAISGSLRRASFNTGLLRAAQVCGPGPRCSNACHSGVQLGHFESLKNAIGWASNDREKGSLMVEPGTVIGVGGRLSGV